MPRAGTKTRLSDPIYGFLAKEMLEFHAAHEWIAHVAYRDFSRRSGFRYAAKVAREELRHFRMLERVYRPEWGGLRAAISRSRRAPAAPVIRSELEFFVANWIFDLAGLVQLEGLQNCSWPAYRRVAVAIRREEVDHKVEGFRRLKERLDARPRDRRRAHALVTRWLELSGRAFGGAGSPFDQLAVKLELKSSTALKQKGRFERAVKNAVKRLPR